jgi:hypothetical protein
MLKRLALLTTALVAISGAVYAYDELNQYQPGPRLIDGSQLNKMVDVVNGITGNGGTAGNIFADTLTANAIAAGDTSLGITGKTNTTTGGTGGAVAVASAAGTAGAATTAGGIGGAVSIASGAGGAKAGTGAAAGGAAGAVTITGGVGGATASAGSDAGGAGGTITITGGTGGAATAGTGNGGAGGSVNLVTGAGGASAGGTAGVGGTIQINGNAGITCPSFFTIGAPAAATDTVFFVATRAYRVISISEVHAVAAGGTSTLQVTKDTSTNAPGAGSDLLQAAFDLNATANTVQNGTLVATLATITLAAGDRLAVDFADAIQSSEGITVTVCLAPL